MSESVVTGCCSFLMEDELVDSLLQGQRKEIVSCERTDTHLLKLLLLSGECKAYRSNVSFGC